MRRKKRGGEGGGGEGGGEGGGGEGGGEGGVYLVARSYLQGDLLLVIKALSQFVLGHRQTLLKYRHRLQTSTKPNETQLVSWRC